MPTTTLPRLTYIVTHPVTARNFLRGHLSRMRQWGFDVTLIASPSPELAVIEQREGVRTIAIPMGRDIAPHRDGLAWWRLRKALRQLKPHIVNASTPKAALLGLLAAKAVRVPIRLYQLRGLRLETSTGWFRRALHTAEKITAGCAHRVYCVSESLRVRYVADGFCDALKTSVLRNGSSNGVEADRFYFDTGVGRAAVDALRDNLGIPPHAPVIGFVGRFVRDKGIFELLDAVDRIRAKRPATWLLLLGDNVAGDCATAELAARIARTPNTIAAGFAAEPAPYYSLMTVLAFPSHREGFPNTPLEAAAAGVPTVGFRATGTIDAIADGLTGRIVEPTAEALADGLLDYLDDRDLRDRHGLAASLRVRRDFDPTRLHLTWAHEYRHWLQIRDLPLPSNLPESTEFVRFVARAIPLPAPKSAAG